MKKVFCALLAALKRRGQDPCSFKSGPDYIDPMFHRAVLGVESRNLDLFFSAPETVRTLYARGAAGHGAQGRVGAQHAMVAEHAHHIAGEAQFGQAGIAGGQAVTVEEDHPGRAAGHADEQRRDQDQYQHQTHKQTDHAASSFAPATIE